MRSAIRPVRLTANLDNQSRRSAAPAKWRILPGLAALIALAANSVAVMAGGLPEIRSSPANPVPSCVSPERLMAFVATRNTKLQPKFATIAATYRELGESTHVRWDYAFFQMLLETNYLMYKRGDGSSGDVGLAQNNFAGIGASGGGVPGDTYLDVRTGVLAHLQHLVAYSGERVERPVAQRTREFQGDIIESSRKLKRPVTFTDLSHRWAADREYARNIETVAELYRKGACGTVAALAAEKPRPALALPSKLGAGGLTGMPRPAARTPLVRTVWQRGDPVPPVPRLAEPRRSAALPVATPLLPLPELKAPPAELSSAPVEAVNPANSGVARFAYAARAGLGAAVMKTPAACRIFSASYGGEAAVLIKHQVGGETRLTTVAVNAEQTQTMTASFLGEHAPDGEVVGHYDSLPAAVAAARALCRAG